MLTGSEIEALEKYLDWLDGFEESVLYEDYREEEGFTDEEYAEVRSILSAAVYRHRAVKEGNIPCQQ